MRRRFLLLLILVLIPLGGMPAHAQSQVPPLVVFIEDQQLQTASITDPGPDGLTRLEQVFKDLGAQTRWLDLKSPLPEETRVVVIVRPLGPLPVDQLARLWVTLVRGGHLLLAIDPVGLVAVRGEGDVPIRSDRANSGLATLLKMFYGISLQDTFVAAPWFALTSITNQDTTLVSVSAENVVQHAVDEPLETYDLPVEMWGARTMTIDPLGPNSYAVPLLYTENGYGEADQGVFNTRGNPSPLELNLGVDSVGRLFTASLAENTRFGSRIVVLGSSTSVLNDYGLAVDADGRSPLHLGNRIFTERVAAWLLDLPAENWPALPDGYTWVSLDGEGSDWEATPALLSDAPNDALVARYDIETVRAFRDDSFQYLLVETAELPNPEARLTLAIENNYDGIPDMYLTITAREVIARSNDGPDEVVPDGRMFVGDALEVRLPLRVTGEGALIGQVCLSDSRTSPDSMSIDCVEQPPALVPVVRTQAPERVRFPDGPRAVVHSLEAAINVRAGPGTDFPVFKVVPNGTLFAATGRTVAGDWIRVENAFYSGWLADFLVALNSPLSNLPVVESPAP
jgi:hypothetical protein